MITTRAHIPAADRAWPRLVLWGAVPRIAASAALLAVVTAVVELLKAHVPVLSLAVLYLLAILPIAVAWGVVYGGATAVASMLAFNFFFLPPLYTFTIRDSRNWFALVAFLVTAVVVSELAARSRRQALESAMLAQVAGTLLERSEVSTELETIAAEIAQALGAEHAQLVLGRAGEGTSGPDRYPLIAGGRRVGTLELRRSRRFGVAAPARVLPALASLLAVAIDRERLARDAVEAETLRRSDAMKTAILRAVSHDLRTPLMAILTSASALARRDFVLDDADRTELLETVLGEARRLDRLVDNLLDLSRLQAGAAEPEWGLVAADDLVLEALESLGDESARVQVALSEEPLAVRVDAHQIQRALVNLIENALKYSQPDEPVSVRVSATSSEVLVRVIDRGVGVPPADLGRIFSPFQRGAVGRSVAGAGLGLAIASGFAEVNGGRVSVESHAGQGATFVLALPLAAVEVPA